MNATGPLTLKFRPAPRLSDAAFWKLRRANPDLRLERTPNGEPVVNPPAGPDSSRRNVSLGAQLWNWNQQTGLGVVFDSSAAFSLPNSAVRGPDASWMTRDRWEALPRIGRERFAHLTPDFVVELRSKRDYEEKRDEYRASGVREYWIIDRFRRIMRVHRRTPEERVEQVVREDETYQTDLLPGFALPLARLLRRTDSWKKNQRPPQATSHAPRRRD